VYSNVGAILYCFLFVKFSSYHNAQFFTLAVNVDDAVDDIVRQFKGVSDDLKRKVVTASSSPTTEGSSKSFTWNMDEMDRSSLRKNAGESALSSDNEEGEKEGNYGHESITREVAEDSLCLNDNELSSKDYSQGVLNHGHESSNLDLGRKHDVVIEAKVGKDVPPTNGTLSNDNPDDPIGVPPEVCVVIWV